jgi:hypothetical protein
MREKNHSFIQYLLFPSPVPATQFNRLRRCPPCHLVKIWREVIPTPRRPRQQQNEYEGMKTAKPRRGSTGENMAAARACTLSA